MTRGRMESHCGCHPVAPPKSSGGKNLVQPYPKGGGKKLFTETFIFFSLLVVVASYPIESEGGSGVHHLRWREKKSKPTGMRWWLSSSTPSGDPQSLLLQYEPKFFFTFMFHLPLGLNLDEKKVSLIDQMDCSEIFYTTYILI